MTNTKIFLACIFGGLGLYIEVVDFESPFPFPWNWAGVIGGVVCISIGVWLSWAWWSAWWIAWDASRKLSAAMDKKYFERDQVKGMAKYQTDFLLEDHRRVALRRHEGSPWGVPEVQLGGDWIPQTFMYDWLKRVSDPRYLKPVSDYSDGQLWEDSHPCRDYAMRATRACLQVELWAVGDINKPKTWVEPTYDYELGRMVGGRELCLMACALTEEMLREEK